MNLNELAAQVHQANIRWWQDIHTGQPIQRNKGELLMMVITELAEAVEGIRKNLMDDKLPHRRMEEVEMADGYIRLLDFAGAYGLELTGFMHCQEDIHYVQDNKADAIRTIAKYVAEIDVDRSHDTAISFCLYQIRLYCLKHNLDLNGAVTEKLAYNATRHDHTHEARKADGGKKF
jgi:hypothetical protein